MRYHLGEFRAVPDMIGPVLRALRGVAVPSPAHSILPRILRMLQQGEFSRLGGNKTLHADVRIIAATNKDLEAEVERGNFREDLFYRLNVVRVHIPPLRHRPRPMRRPCQPPSA